MNNLYATTGFSCTKPRQHQAFEPLSTLSLSLWPCSVSVSRGFKTSLFSMIIYLRFEFYYFYLDVSYLLCSKLSHVIADVTLNMTTNTPDMVFKRLCMVKLTTNMTWIQDCSRLKIVPTEWETHSTTQVISTLVAASCCRFIPISANYHIDIDKPIGVK